MSENEQQQQQQPYRDPTGLRVLCLHDAHSSASDLKALLKNLGDRLYVKHGIDLVYINSPLCASVQSDSDRHWFEAASKKQRQQQAAANKFGRTQQQEHQQEQEAQSSSESPEEDQPQLIGLDASLCLLQQIWNSMPFWGILGIGQGAAIGSLLSLLPNIKPRAKFGIFVQGEALIQEAERLVDADDWSCLHVLDPDNLSGTEERLILQFGGDVHRIRRKDNDAYLRKIMNIMGKFIIDEKKKIRKSNGASTALALQNQLYVVEQEAAQFIAKRIAENPPSVLMAVVAPKAVAAAPGGMKRRGKDEEGGGAPCPPEFLLRRQTRQAGDGEKHEASRAHPSEAKSGTEK